MNKEEYVNQLMKKSKYCNCPQLSEISKIGEESRKLEKICGDFDASLDLKNPKMKDLDNLLDYANVRKKFEANVEEYNSQLSSLLNNGDLKLNLHSYNGSWKKRKITINSLAKLPKKSVIAINCAYCNQQIDILNSYKFMDAHQGENTHKEQSQ